MTLTIATNRRGSSSVSMTNPLRCRCPLCEGEPAYRAARLERCGPRLRQRHPVLEAVVGDVADLEAANTDRLSRPPHLRG
jgi:hypothetical protein